MIYPLKLTRVPSIIWTWQQIVRRLHLFTQHFQAHANEQNEGAWSWEAVRNTPRMYLCEKKKKRLGHTVQRFRWMNKGTCTYTHFQLNKLYRSRSLLSWDDRHTTIRCNNWRTGEGRSAYGDSRIACSVKWRQRVNRTIEWVTIPQWPLFESVHTTWSSTIQRARCCRRAQWEKTRISVCTLRGTQKKDTIFVRT